MPSLNELKDIWPAKVASKNDQTKKIYGGHWDRWLQSCGSIDVNPIPVQVPLFLMHVSELPEEKQHVACCAIRHIATQYGVPKNELPPTLAQVQQGGVPDAVKLLMLDELFELEGSDLEELLDGARWDIKSAASTLYYQIKDG